MTQPSATDNADRADSEHDQDLSHSEHDHEEFDPEEEPIGTLAILSVYLIIIVGLWVAVYVTLIERS